MHHLEDFHWHKHQPLPLYPESQTLSMFCWNLTKGKAWERASERRGKQVKEWTSSEQSRHSPVLSLFFLPFYSDIHQDGITLESLGFGKVTASFQTSWMGRFTVITTLLNFLRAEGLYITSQNIGMFIFCGFNQFQSWENMNLLIVIVLIGDLMTFSISEFQALTIEKVSSFWFPLRSGLWFLCKLRPAEGGRFT